MTAVIISFALERLRRALKLPVVTFADGKQGFDLGEGARMLANEPLPVRKGTPAK
jgi:hypothetical protein